MKFCRKLLIGPNVIELKSPSSIKSQIQNLSYVWNNGTPTIGIERIFRLFLILVQFGFPNLYIREISSFKKNVKRRLSIEFYVLFKLFLPILILIFSLEHMHLIRLLTAYLILETIFYLLGIVLLSDLYPKPISYKRSLILIFVDFVEVTLNFAVLYGGLDAISSNGNKLSAVYYSFVTGTTVGFGDILPVSSFGQILVISQSLIFLLFIVVFFSHFVSHLSSNHLVDKTLEVWNS